MAASLREARRFDSKSFNTEVETLASFVRGAAHRSLEEFAVEAITGLRELLSARHVTAFACMKADARVLLIAESGEPNAVRPRNLDGSVRRAVLRREAFATRTKDGHSLWAAIETPDRSIILHVVRNERPFAPHEIQAADIVLALSASLATHERVAREAQEQAKGVLDLLRSNPWPVLIYDAHSGRCIEANDAAVETYGFSRAEFLGRTLGTPTKPLQIFQPQRAITCRQRKKNGTELLVEQTACALSIEGQLLHVVVARDVTERPPAPNPIREAATQQQVGRFASWVSGGSTSRPMSVSGPRNSSRSRACRSPVPFRVLPAPPKTCSSGTFIPTTKPGSSPNSRPLRIRPSRGASTIAPSAATARSSGSK